MPATLRGSGPALNSTALIRLYRGRVRFSSVTYACTAACFSSVLPPSPHQTSAPILSFSSRTRLSVTSGHWFSLASSSSGLTFSG